MKNLVSFIVPTFNSEKTIGKCIESILDQKCEKEVIVVDNNSTDNTAKIIKKYSVRYLFEKRKGAAAARNKGLENAKGEYVGFIDSDVVLPEDWVVKALEEIKPKDIAGVGGRGISVEKNVI